MLEGVDRVPCPACGGAGGGPFGRAGSAWDDESYVCPRCEGLGVVSVEDATDRPRLAKGLAKTAAVAAAEAEDEPEKATGASGRRKAAG